MRHCPELEGNHRILVRLKLTQTTDGFEDAQNQMQIL